MDALTRVRRKSSKSKTDEPASPVTAAASSGAKDQQHKDHGHNSTIAGTAEQLAAPPGGGGAAAATAGPVVSCAACGNPAFLKFACGGCKTERFYCQTYSCQFDDWSQHQTDCTALINSIYKEDTVITRLNDHSSWERRRRRSVDIEFQERVPIMDINAAQIIRPDQEGYLANPGDSLQNWKLRWFVLKEDMLICFENERAMALGGILVTNYQVRSADEELKEKNSIKLYRTDGPAHYFVAQSRDECTSWIKAFSRAALTVNPAEQGGPGSLERSNSSMSIGGGRRTGSTLSLHVPNKNSSKSTPELSADMRITRSILLRNVDVNKNATLRPRQGNSLFGGSDRLVRVRPTETLCDMPTPEDAQNTVSRSAALNRILAQPASYPRSTIRLMAVELGSDKLSQFATQRNSSSIANFFKRTGPRAGSHADLLHGSSSAARGPGSSHTLQHTSPKLRRSLHEIDFAVSGGGGGGKSALDPLSPLPNAHHSTDNLRSSPTGTTRSDDSISKAPSTATDETEFDLNSVGSTVSRGSRTGGFTSSSSSASTVTSSSQPQPIPGSLARQTTPDGFGGSGSGSRSSLTLQRRNRGNSNASTQSFNGWGGASPGQGRRKSVVVGMDGAPPLMPPLLTGVSPSIGSGGSNSPVKQLPRSGSFESVAGSVANESTLDRPSFLEGFLERVLPTGEVVRLWFVLDDFYMRAYESEDSVICVLEVDLEGCTIEEDETTGFSIRHGEHSLHVRAYDINDRMQWLNVIGDMRDYFIATSEQDSVGIHRTDSLDQGEGDSIDFLADIERIVGDIQAQSQLSVGGQPPTVEALSRLQLTAAAAAAAASKRSSTSAPTTPATPTTNTTAGSTAALTIGTISARASAEVADNAAPAAAASTASTAAPKALSPSRQARKPTVLVAKAAAGTFSAPTSPTTPTAASSTDPSLPTKKATDRKLSAEEIKDYALKTGGTQDDSANSKNVVFRQDGDNSVVLQFSVGDDGKEDKYTIAAGTLDQLVSRLADENNPDTGYIDIFLLTYRHFLSPAAFIDRLISRFYLVAPDNATAEQKSYFDQWAKVIQVRTIGVVKKWIDNYYVDFDSDPDAYQGLVDFLEMAEESSFGSLTQRLRSIVAQKKEAIKAQLDKEKETKKDEKRKTKVDFLQIEPRELARQLTLIDHAKFKAIEPVEFVTRLWEGNSVSSKNLNAFIDWFNRISFFVATLICVQPNVKKRANIADNFIKAAKELLRLRNYNSAMAILSGLSNASVRRLKKTWAIVPPKSMETLQQIETTMASAFNYKTYRALMDDMDKFPKPDAVVPFMGLFLRDLTFLNDGNPKKFKGGLYNFAKLRMIAQRVFRLQAYQSATYVFPSSRNTAMVREFLENPNAMTDENALYKCSLLNEPREDGTGPQRLIDKWAQDNTSSGAGTGSGSNSPTGSTHHHSVGSSDTLGRKTKLLTLRSSSSSGGSPPPATDSYLLQRKKGEN